MPCIMAFSYLWIDSIVVGTVATAACWSLDEDNLIMLLGSNDLFLFFNANICCIFRGFVNVEML